jgi:hypothetical protein
MLQADFVQTRLSKSAAFRITVENRDYHQLSHFEIASVSEFFNSHRDYHYLFSRSPDSGYQ